jgi:hypothetical protein
MNEPELRAGDEDRDKTIARLREAYAEGRLEPNEFNDRLDQAHAAKTFADLSILTADLPHDPPRDSTHLVQAAKERRELRSAWAAWLGVGVLVNIIWFATWMGNGPAPYYWPIWVMGPWGGAMLIWTLTARMGRPEDG